MGSVTLLGQTQGQGVLLRLWAPWEAQETGWGEISSPHPMLEMTTSFSQTEMDSVIPGLSELWKALCANWSLGKTGVVPNF